MGGGETGSITISVRVRPFTEREKSDSQNYCAVDIPEARRIRCRRKDALSSIFAVDHVIWSFNDDEVKAAKTSQQEVYSTVGLPLLTKALAGYNACLLAYGVTSSGKTYSMFGTPDNPGIIPRTVVDLFAHINARKGINDLTTVHFSYYEIYNEKIFDLLLDKKAPPQPISVREHPKTGTYIEGLLKPEVHSQEEVFSWLRRGDCRRRFASTAMNARSSRSHTIACFTITRRELAKFTKKETVENVFKSQLNLVDLAGSERQSATSGLGERLVESCQINKSLFTLGRVISQLSEDVESADPSTRKRRQNRHVSYRDSLLTLILKDSLGGNSVTTMLATVSPSSLHVEDTISTLHYAKRAQKIVNQAVVNEDPRGRHIRELTQEVERLRKLLEDMEKPGSCVAGQLSDLCGLLDSKQAEIERLTEELTKRTMDCERLKAEVSQVIMSTPMVRRERRFSDNPYDPQGVEETPIKRRRLVSFSNEEDGDEKLKEEPEVFTKDRLCPDGADKSDLSDNSDIAWATKAVSFRDQCTMISGSLCGDGGDEVKVEEEPIEVEKFDVSVTTAPEDVVIRRSQLEGLQAELEVKAAVLKEFTDVEKQETGVGVNETEFGLVVISADEFQTLLESVKPAVESKDVQTNTQEDLEVLPKSQVHYMNERIKMLDFQLSDIASAAKAEAGTSTEDLDYQVIPSASYDEIMVEVKALSDRLDEIQSRSFTDAATLTDQVSELAKVDVNTSSGDLGYQVVPSGHYEEVLAEARLLSDRLEELQSKNVADAGTSVDELEVGWTCITMSHFYELYEKQRKLRSRLERLENISRADAAVSTNSDVQVVSQKELVDLHNRAAEMKAKLEDYEERAVVESKSANTSMTNGVVVNQSRLEQLSKEIEALESKVRTYEAIQRADVSTEISGLPEETKLIPPKEWSTPARTSRPNLVMSPLNGDETTIVRRRIKYFESLHQQQVVITGRNTPVPPAKTKENIIVAVAEKRKPPAPGPTEAANDEVELLTYELKRQQWELNYLKEVNNRLSYERNVLARVLTKRLSERGERVDTEAQETEDMEGLPQASVEFRREMDDILKQYELSQKDDDSAPELKNK